VFVFVCAMLSWSPLTWPVDIVFQHFCLWTSLQFILSQMKTKLLCTLLMFIIFKNDTTYTAQLVAETRKTRLSGSTSKSCGKYLRDYWQLTVPQIFKLLPKRHIFFDIVIEFITNWKYAFFCIFYVRLSDDNIILIYWIRIYHVQL